MGLRRSVSVGTILFLSGAGLAGAAGSHVTADAAPPPPPAPHAAPAPHTAPPAHSAPATGFGHNAAPSAPAARGFAPAARGFGHNAAPSAGAGSGHSSYGLGSASSSPGYQVHGGGAASASRFMNETWMCPRFDGTFYRSIVPCPDETSLMGAVGAYRSGVPSVGLDGYVPGYGAQAASGANWSAEPASAALGLPQNQGPNALPVFTNLSRIPAPYAIVLKGGTALASLETPRRIGNLIVGRDRVGRLYSIRASEVDGKAAPLPAATPHKP